MDLQKVSVCAKLMVNTGIIKYKDLVFKLVDYINENVTPSQEKYLTDFECQTEPIVQKVVEIDYKLKRQYEDLVEEWTGLKKQIVLKNQEIQKLKLNLYSKNLEYKKQVQNNARINTDKDALREKFEECQR